MMPTTSQIATYTNVRIKASYYNSYMVTYYYFTLYIKSYCSIVPFKMTTIADQVYKIADPALEFTFSIRMDCYFGAIFTVTLSNGHSLYSFVTFDSTFL
jgi:hypothetical protein